jgi:hypothetical protein
MTFDNRFHTGIMLALGLGHAPTRSGPASVVASPSVAAGGHVGVAALQRIAAPRTLDRPSREPVR